MTLNLSLAVIVSCIRCYKILFTKLTDGIHVAPSVSEVIGNWNSFTRVNDKWNHLSLLLSML